MPILSKGSLKIDHTDDGQGEPIVLIHSSVSANRQWRALTEVLKDRYRVLAINLFGYGETAPWPESSPQSLYAQAQLVLALCEEMGSPLHLLGHSFGGSVALKAAIPRRSRKRTHFCSLERTQQVRRGLWGRSRSSRGESPTRR